MEKPPKNKSRRESFGNLGQVECGILVRPEPENNKRKRVSVENSYDPEFGSLILERAKAVQNKLAPEFPSLVKTMLQSHVTRGFWLALPKNFCSKHLPEHDVMISLEDESGKVYETKYLAEKTGLSGGWRSFSIAHELVEGDAVVFHLISPLRFKIYIIRSNCSDEVDCALGLLKLEANTTRTDTDIIVTFEKKIEALEPLVEANLEGIFQNNSLRLCSTNIVMPDQSDDDSNNIGSEVMDGIRLSDSAITFKEVKNIENFNVLVNGLVINSELSKYLLAKYYDLCSSQKVFLHEHLLEGLNCKLAAGIISETINIADAIRASKINTLEDHFSTWETTLKAFEVLGMNVAFLRARLDQLVNLSSKSKRYRKAKLEQKHAEEELKALEAKVLEVKERINNLDAEIVIQRVNFDGLEEQEVSTVRSEEPLGQWKKLLESFLSTNDLLPSQIVNSS